MIYQKKRLKHGIKNIVGLLFQKMEFAVISSINNLPVHCVAYLSYKDKTLKMHIHIRRIFIIIGSVFFLIGSIDIIF